MFIERNGQTFELTPKELRLAATEYNCERYGEDVMKTLDERVEEEDNFPLTKEDYRHMSEAEQKIFEERAVDLLEKALGNNDAYWEAFWSSAEQAVEDTAILHSAEGMTFSLLKKIFCAHEKAEAKKPYDERKHLTAHITISADSFTREYSEKARTYEVSSGNKYFIPEFIGNSLFGTSLDGVDTNVRLDRYLKDAGNKNGWTIEKIRLIR